MESEYRAAYFWPYETATGTTDRYEDIVAQKINGTYIEPPNTREYKLKVQGRVCQKPVPEPEPVEEEQNPEKSPSKRRQSPYLRDRTIARGKTVNRGKTPAKDAKTRKNQNKFKITTTQRTRPSYVYRSEIAQKCQIPNLQGPFYIHWDSDKPLPPDYAELESVVRYQ